MNTIVNSTPEQMGKGIRFNRLRRITGYLTDSLEHWGDSKRAEEHDRLKHSMSNIQFGR